ncbi:MAG TPA: murein biosynthesis integral membrane protein MurJ [Vicinamibacterales bacterium]|nr:murein biosynthesis integral membrane protein MurJ [Vicinamibacterales bacterium]
MSAEHDADAPAKIPQSPQSLERSASLAGAATLTSRILGLARESVLAAVFGASNEMDAFLVALRLPNLVRDLFAEGAMSAAFVPTFTRHLRSRGKADAWRLANNVLTMLILISGSLVIFGVVFARPIVTAYAGEYAAVPGKLDLTIQLTRITLPFLTLISIAAVVMGMLNSLQHYFLPALSPATFNIASIACAIGLVPVMPAVGLPRIMALAIGAILGGIGQIAIQWPSLRREGFRYKPFLDLGDDGLRRVLSLMGPGTIGLAATQVNVFVNTLLATQQGTGAVSWLTYAFRLMYLPIGLFGVSIATALLPHASHHAAANDQAAIRRTVADGIGLMLAVNIPAMFGLIVLSEPIAQVLFQRGRFLPSDTAATAAALRFYAIGLIGYSAARIVSPVFYAINRNRVPVIVSVATIALNIAASLTLTRFLSFRGLALGTSIAALFNGGMLTLLLGRAIGGIDGRRLSATLFKSIVAASIMAAVAHLSFGWLDALLGEGSISQIVALGSAIALSMAGLAAAATLLRIHEFEGRMRALVNAIGARLVR